MDDRTITVQLAKLQSDIEKTEREIAKSDAQIRSLESSVGVKEREIIAAQQREFDKARERDMSAVSTICNTMYSEIEEFLQSLPGEKAKEFAGKMEVESLERTLQSFYPADLVHSYIPLYQVEPCDDGEAYKLYTSAERGAARLRSATLSTKIYSAVRFILLKTSKEGTSGTIPTLVFSGVILLCLLFFPFLFLSCFTVLGTVSIIHGMLSRKILDNIYSVKKFLNATYDEDIFQEDTRVVMADVRSILDRVKQEYQTNISGRVFTHDERKIEEIRQSIKRQIEVLSQKVSNLQVELDSKKSEAADLIGKLEEYNKAQEERAKTAQKEFLETVDWKYEWLQNIFLDITKDNRIIGCKWSPCNSIFYSNSFSTLQTFWQLAIYQGMLHMHPDFAGQVVLDYKYMGSNLMQFSAVKSSLFSLLFEKEDINAEIERIKSDIRARCANILKSCENLEAFNKLMATYDSTGEAYVIVHICGLQSVTENLLNFLRNGPKVGYLFKIYLTLEELVSIGGDFPLSDFQEIYEIQDTALPRSATAVQRLLNEDA